MSFTGLTHLTSEKPGVAALPAQLFTAALILSASVTQAADPFAEFVRRTEPLTPEAELRALHVPPGFEVQLVASEPDIGKPMNMAFDSRGRLWVTQSREYPYAAPLDKPARDAIKVLSDFDEKGHARKVTTFVEGLNIPIGLYPFKEGVIAFSIPNIYYYRDTNRDGRADTQHLLLGRFGFEKDTHGLTSSFRRGFDGWIYADHGYNNTSTLIAVDGSSITMNSGNTYRFLPGGSRVEQHTWGQVNPFGLMFDPLGDLWSADCHSSPVYQLLRGAYYPSFGKPHDGLGFAPEICRHNHRSTAIAGLVYYAADHFPAEYRGNTFVGNVMTCRVNRDSFSVEGSTRIAKEQPDFVTSDDPWFRPVDLQLGPDGALYIADFYNRIIGHYEVPLEHPGRDRERGRIWRVVYRGTDEGAQPRRFRQPGNSLAKFDLSRASVKQLIAELGDPNLTRRMLAMNELVDRIGQAAIDPLKRELAGKAAPMQRAHGLWVLHRLGGLDEATLAAAAKATEPVVRVHAMRVLAEKADWGPQHRGLALVGLLDHEPHVQRAAAEALGRHPAPPQIRSLLDLRGKVSPKDTLLLHATRMALRDQLLPKGVLARLQNSVLSESDSRALADVAVAVKSNEAADFLLKHVQSFPENREKIADYLRHTARYGASERAGDLATFTRTHFEADIDFQLALFKSVEEGAAQRGGAANDALRDWGTDLAGRLFDSADPASLQWRNSPVPGADPTNPWLVETRRSADGNHSERFLCSFSPGGEKFTGILRSKTFIIPPTLKFFMAGHDGVPDQPMHKKNFARLRDAQNHQVLAENPPPRNDLAQPVTWNLTQHAGKEGYLEVVDGNSTLSFAWLAVGRFDPPVIEVPPFSPNVIARRQQAAAELAGAFQLTSFEPKLGALLVDRSADTAARAAAARSLAALQPEAHLLSLSNMLADTTEPVAFRERVAETLGRLNSPRGIAALTEALRNAPSSFEKQLAVALASSLEGAEALLAAVEQGKASARLLQDRAIQDRLRVANPPDWQNRTQTLTAPLSTANADRVKLIDQRRAAFASSGVKSSTDPGVQLFKQHCSVCHAIDGQGALIAPQLDGIGARGLDRLLEDVLDPNRNVDRAFRTTLLVKKGGDVESGLFRREEGEMLVLADSTGKEMRVPKAEVEERRESESSLMPDNFNELMTPEDFNSLLAYLLSKGSAK